ncbi:MAG: peptidoglycan editing factor PgeF [Tannerella sp.]|jgi:YfiH family protein|nr:peptidoglycan editing factor PgeF [Tannerella sp.]
MELLSFFKPFNKQLIAVSTSRKGGVSVGDYSSLNLCHYVGDDEEYVVKNRQHFCRILAFSPDRLFFPRQTHSDYVLNLNDDFLKLSSIEQLQLLEGVDALVTNKRQVGIGIFTADCVPVFLYDTVRQAIGIVHAGWRGTSAQIVSKTILLMQKTFDTDPKDLIAALGPCISQKNYAVGDELYDVFYKACFPVNELFIRQPLTSKWHFDLRAANRWLLMEAGVPIQQIEMTDICTYDQSDRYFSARKLGIQSGRITSCLMLI